MAELEAQGDSINAQVDSNGLHQAPYTSHTERRRERRRVQQLCLNTFLQTSCDDLAENSAAVMKAMRVWPARDVRTVIERRANPNRYSSRQGRDGVRMRQNRHRALPSQREQPSSNDTSDVSDACVIDGGMSVLTAQPMIRAWTAPYHPQMHHIQPMLPVTSPMHPPRLLILHGWEFWVWQALECTRDARCKAAVWIWSRRSDSFHHFQLLSPREHVRKFSWRLGPPYTTSSVMPHPHWQYLWPKQDNICHSWYVVLLSRCWKYM